MDPNTLTRMEHQELVLMLGSKKGWQTFLGLDDRTARSTWIDLALKAPTDYARSMEAGELAKVVLSMGHDRAAAHMGMSGSALKTILIEKGLAQRTAKPELDREALIEHLTRLGSIRFVARLLQTTEGHVRAEATRHELDPRLLIDYSTGNNSNAKGRRAELDFIDLRGAKITADRNLIDGSQADWDVDDADLGKVNVKSSKRYRFKARTRKDAPDYWKHSLSGGEKCDHFVLMCYCPRGETLEGIMVLAASNSPGGRTITVTRSQLDDPKKWTTA